MLLCALAILGFLEPQAAAWSLRATIRDSRGAPVRDLSPTDVSLADNGATLVLDRFERDERAARIALVIDSSQPMGSAYRLQFVDAAQAFVASLPSSTRVVVWTTGDRPVKVVEDVDLSQEGATREMVSRLKRIAPMGGNTLLDAMAEAAADLQKAEGDRRILVVLSAEGPGFLNDTRDGIVDRVLKTGVEVAGVLVPERGEGSGGEVSSEDYDYVLANLTSRTGGLLERPLSVMGASTALRRVATDLLSTYRLSFHSTASRKFKMTLQVARPGVKVRLSAPQKETSSP